MKASYRDDEACIDGEKIMQPEYTKLKVNNEIELCETADMEVKQQIEKILLKNRISYYMKWRKQGMLWRNRDVCVICVNDSARDEAEQLIRSELGEKEDKVKFLMRKSEESFF